MPLLAVSPDSHRKSASEQEKLSKSESPSHYLQAGIFQLGVHSKA